MTPLRVRKQEARREALARRNALTTATREAVAEAVRKRVVALPEWTHAHTIAVYVAVASEVDTRGLIADALAAGKRVAVPRTDEARHALVMHEVRSLGELSPGAYRVPEPDPAVHPDLAPADVDLVCVPGVVFDHAGHRLGYGRGFFDRFLATCPGVKVGLAYDGLVADVLPAESHDEPVDVVVTEARVLRPRRA